MFEAEVMEFPFVAAMPKREKSKLAKLWDRMQEVGRVQDRVGPIMPVAFAAGLLDISTQRCHQLMQAGQLERVEIEGHPFISQRSIVELAQAERKAGRPFKTPTRSREMWNVAHAAAKEIVRKAK